MHMYIYIHTYVYIYIPHHFTVWKYIVQNCGSNPSNRLAVYEVYTTNWDARFRDLLVRTLNLFHL